MDLKTKLCNYAFILSHNYQILYDLLNEYSEHTDNPRKEEISELARTGISIVNKIQNISTELRQTGEID